MGPSTERDSQHLFAPGDEVAGRFRIVRELGHGGMGIVYEAIDTKLACRVALKCARPGHHNRLPPEARHAREVSHFNVCKVHELHTSRVDSGEVDFLSMEFVEGETLSRHIRHCGPLADEEAGDIALQICAGLAQAHRQGVVHGDLKCGNIILAPSAGGRVRAVITDFGLAKPVGAAGTPSAPAGREGTIDYMAPELFLGRRATIASDVYALGVLFHVMLTGVSPRRASEPAVELATESDSQAPTVTVGHTEASVNEAEWQRELGDVPARWKAIVSRCLAPRAANRFASADEVARELAAPSQVLKRSIIAAIVSAVAFASWYGEESGPRVRLAVLPVAVEGGAEVAAGAGIGSDVAERLSRVRGKLTVIRPSEALLNDVSDAAKARAVFGATHVLRTRLRQSGSLITAFASVEDTASGQSLRELQGAYSAGDLTLIANALVGTVTGAFHLRPAAPQASVSRQAYHDYFQGLDLLARDDARSAAAHFANAVHLDPHSPLPWAGLAQAQIARFRNGEGREWLDRAGASVAQAKGISPDSSAVLMAAAAWELEHGWYEQAIGDYGRATELDPNDSIAWESLARVYEAANRPGDAAETYRRAITMQPDYYKHYVDFGNFYFFRGAFPRAEELYRKVTTLAPGYGTGHMNLGLALMEQGRFEEAERALLAAVRLNRSADSLLNLGALYYEEERYTEAAGLFEQSLAAGSPSLMIYRNLGDVYRHLGRRTAADAAYRSGREIAELEVAANPRRASSRVLLALMDAFLGERRIAEFELAQAIELAPEDAMVMREAVIAFEAIGARERSLKVLRRAPRYVLQELNLQPDVRGLRQDVRFQEMLRNNASE